MLLTSKSTNEEVIKCIVSHWPSKTFGYYKFIDTIIYLTNYVQRMKDEPIISEELIQKNSAKYWEESVAFIKENRQILEDTKVIKKVK